MMLEPFIVTEVETVMSNISVNRRFDENRARTLKAFCGIVCSNGGCAIMDDAIQMDEASLTSSSISIQQCLPLHAG